MARRTGRAAQPTHGRSVLRVRGGGALRFVLVADTHGAPHPDSARHIAAQRPDHILHAGDVGDRAALDVLARIAPVTAVRGNVDELAPDLPDAATVEVQDDEGTLLTVLLLHIAIYGTKLRAEAVRLARAEHASLVVCGHSHVPFLGRDRGMFVVNPGSIGPRRFHLPIVFGVMDVRRDRVSVHHVDCETGRRWEP